MSNISEDNPIELEKKFLVSREVAELLIGEFEKTGQKAEKKRIEQNYLFKENASVKYDVENEKWNVTLKTGNKSETFSFFEKRFPEVAREIFTPYANTDLLDTKCATRIRIMDGEPIFTFKRPVDDGEGDNEFEDNIKDIVENSSVFSKFINNDPYKVKKDRFVIQRNGFDYEIDFFDDINLSKQNKELDISILESKDLCLLEIEFNSQESYDDFKPDFVGIDVTEVKGFGNKKMAKKLGKDALKKERKKNNRLS